MSYKKDMASQPSDKKKRRNWYLRFEDWLVNLFDRTSNEEDQYETVEVEELDSWGLDSERQKVRKDRASKRIDLRIIRKAERDQRRNAKNIDPVLVTIIALGTLGIIAYFMHKKRKNE